MERPYEETFERTKRGFRGLPRKPPLDQEINVIRQLISRIKGDIAGLSPADRARIDEAVAVVRKHRAVSIGMPRLRSIAQSLTPETKGQAL